MLHSVCWALQYQIHVTNTITLLHTLYMYMCTFTNVHTNLLCIFPTASVSVCTKLLLTEKLGLVNTVRSVDSLSVTLVFDNI